MPRRSNPSIEVESLVSEAQALTEFGQLSEDIIQRTVGFAGQIGLTSLALDDGKRVELSTAILDHGMSKRRKIKLRDPSNREDLSLVTDCEWQRRRGEPVLTRTTILRIEDDQPDYAFWSVVCDIETPDAQLLQSALAIIRDKDTHTIGRKALSQVTDLMGGFSELLRDSHKLG